MCSNVTFIARHITVLGTGDKQTGFCRNGINFKASKDALIILRGFFSFLVSWYNRQNTLSRAGNYFKGHEDYPVIAKETSVRIRYSPALKISGFKLSFPDSLSRVDKKSKPNLERVKEFSPEMDFFSSSTVMPQRDLTGQDYLLITLPMISKRVSSYMVSQERKR